MAQKDGTNFYILMRSQTANHYSAFTDENGYVLSGKFDTVATPDTTANVFQKGCQMTKTDAANNVKAVYENVGTLAAPSWNLMGQSIPGDITLAQGSILVGNASSVAAAVAAQGNAQILIGNGTTLNSVAVTGIVAIDNAGLTTIPLTSAQILVGSAGNLATAVAMSGDVAISNTGATTIQAGAVTETKLVSSRSFGLGVGLRSARAKYDFAVDGGVFGAPITLATNATIPDNAIIIGGILNSTTAVTSAGGTATISFGTTAGSGPATLKNAEPQATFVLDAITGTTPVLGTPITWFKMTAAGQITMTIGVENLLTGVIEVTVYYQEAAA